MDGIGGARCKKWPRCALPFSATLLVADVRTDLFTVYSLTMSQSCVGCNSVPNGGEPAGVLSQLGS